jgi:hypothetical protein
LIEIRVDKGDVRIPFNRFSAPPKSSPVGRTLKIIVDLWAVIRKKTNVERKFKVSPTGGDLEGAYERRK